MRISGKVNLREVKDFMIAFCVAVVVGLVVYGVFALLSFISWILAWMLIAIILTPVAFWFKRFVEDDIYIDTDPDDEDDYIS